MKLPFAPARLLRCHWLLAGLVGLFACVSAARAEHRATRLGHPSTRFAPPLTTTEGLRALLTNEVMQADVEAILLQAKWTGRPADLRRAAATAEINEVKLPKGTRLPFMSARKDGKPLALMDVLWVGDEPIEAYEFFFSSVGHRWRCVTPKPCSNFLVIDLGPDQPALSLVNSAPEEASRCGDFNVKLTVRNTCTVPLTQVRVTYPLPDGWRTGDGQTALSLDGGELAPGAGKQFSFYLQPSTTGTFTNRAEAVCAEGAKAEAAAVTQVRAPVLTLDCAAPATVLMGRTAEVCLTLKNTGDAAETNVTVTLPLPADAKASGATGGALESATALTWEFASLAPGASERLCANFLRARPGTLAVTATARGNCSPAVESRCSVQVRGVGGVLVEVVDVADPIPVGGEVTYEIRVTNQGLIPLTTNSITCEIPAQQQYVSGSGATAVTAQDRTVTMAPLAVLEPKAQATWRVVTKALSAGDARFKVSFQSAEFAKPIEEDESTTHF